MNILNIEFNTDLNGFTVLTDATTDRVNIQFNKCSNVLSAKPKSGAVSTKVPSRSNNTTLKGEITITTAGSAAGNLHRHLWSTNIVG